MSPNAAAKRRQRAKSGECVRLAEVRRTRYRVKERDAALARRTDPKRWSRQNYGAVRYRARQEGRECDYDPDLLVVPAVCPVLGIPLIPAGPQRNRPSLDRFDNARGYTQDNVRIISHRANQLKRDATVDEIRRVLAYMMGETPSLR